MVKRNPPPQTLHDQQKPSPGGRGVSADQLEMSWEALIARDPKMWSSIERGGQ